MSKFFYLYLFAGLILLALAIFYMVTPPLDSITQKNIKLANENYKNAQTTRDVFEREAGFNKALSVYKDLENTIESNNAKGKLYFNIGNSYFLLEMYSWAIFYYYKSLNFLPNDTTIHHSLETALNILGSKLNGENYFGLKDANKFNFIFLIISLALFVSISMVIWFNPHWLRGLAISCLTLWVASGIYLTYLNLFTPPFAVLIEGSFLSHEPNDNTSNKVLLYPGNKVKVLDYKQTSDWAQIVDEEGNLGFVPSEKIKIIE